MYVYGIGVNNKYIFRWMYGKLDILFKINIENDFFFCSGSNLLILNLFIYFKCKKIIEYSFMVRFLFYFVKKFML